MFCARVLQSIRLASCCKRTPDANGHQPLWHLFAQVLAELVQGMVADDPPAKADAVIAEVSSCTFDS